jgi:protein FrlC
LGVFGRLPRPKTPKKSFSPYPELTFISQKELTVVKLGTATSVLFQYALEDAIPLIARVGFDGVDIWGGRPHVYRQDYSVEELRVLRRQIEDHGLVVSSFMPAFYRYPHSLSSPNPRVRQDSIQYMRECIDNAALLGAKIVLIVPDHSLYGQLREDSLTRFTESIAVVSHYAAQYAGLMLGLEVLYYDETDFLNSSEDALSIIETLGFENIGVVADSGTMNLSKETPREMVEKLGSRLLQVHVNDNHGREEQENLIPGDGSFDFPALVRYIKECAFPGFLSAELTKGYSANPEPALRATVERMRSWEQAS